MAAPYCPTCGHVATDPVAVCVRCGGSLGQDAPIASPMPRGRTALPLFPVATHKFIVLSICTGGIYELYWCYQNWKRLKQTSAEHLSPFWRAFFAPLWGFSLFKRVAVLAGATDVPVQWSSGLLATLYLVASALWKLPDPWWLISLGSFAPMIPVQQAAQRINAHYSAQCPEAPNNTYSTANLATIVVGVLLLILVIIGTFVP